MAITTTKIGPGVLSIGAIAFQAQCQSAVVQVTENVDSTDAIPVLDGTTLAAVDTATYTYALAVTFLQDLGVGVAAGIVAYSWANVGTTKAFVYTPNNGAAAGSKTVSGNLRVVPINIGGEAGPDPASSDVVFAIIGTPTLT